MDWDQEIAADVKEECGKYGPVSHLWVDKASKGYIYAMFGTASGAGVAQKALHGRFFAGKQVLCGAPLPALCAARQFAAQSYKGSQTSARLHDTCQLFCRCTDEC